jgi:hypothetical protein
MRSRYSAFALGLGSYLVETLAATHPDRSRPPAELARELGQAHRTQRWRYAAGELLPAGVFGSALADLTRDTFLTHLKRAAAPAPPGPTPPR